MNMKTKIKEIFETLLLNPWWQKTSTDCMIRFIVSVVFAAASFVLGILDYINQSWLMLVTSVILAIGFAISAVVTKVFQRADISSDIIACLVCFVLSTYIFTGGNDGFACLWVLLVPILAVNVLGVTIGFSTATYFLLFIFVMFYSPLNVYIEDKYTPFFLSRFPVLYLSDYILSLFLSFQKEYFSRKVHLQAYTDALTGCYNRRYFNEQLSRISAEADSEYSIVLIDVNGLKAVNDTLGHEAGDELICAVPDCYAKAFEGVQNSSLCRTGGDEYIILIEQPKEKVEQLLSEMKHQAENWSGEYSKEFCYASGCASNKDFPELTSEQLHKKADDLMYADKTAYYMNSGKERRKASHV